MCIDYRYSSKLIAVYWKLHALRIIKNQIKMFAKRKEKLTAMAFNIISINRKIKNYKSEAKNSVTHYATFSIPILTIYNL